MLNSCGLVGLKRTRLIRCYGAERRGVFGYLRVSRFLQSGEEKSQCG